MKEKRKTERHIQIGKGRNTSVNQQPLQTSTIIIVPVVILHLTHRALIFCESKGRLSFQDVCLYLCNVIQRFNIRDAAEQVAKNSHHRKYRVELMVFTRLILIHFCSPAKQAKHTSWSPCRLDLLPPVIKDLMWVYAQGRRFLSAVEENLTS